MSRSCYRLRLGERGRQIANRLYEFVGPGGADARRIDDQGVAVDLDDDVT